MGANTQKSTKRDAERAPGIALDIYSHAFPGMQVEAEKFDRIFDGDVGENSGLNVGRK